MEALSAIDQVDLQEALEKAIEYICHDMKCPFDVYENKNSSEESCGDNCGGNMMSDCWRTYFMGNS